MQMKQTKTTARWGARLRLAASTLMVVSVLAVLVLPVVGGLAGGNGGIFSLGVASAQAQDQEQPGAQETPPLPEQQINYQCPQGQCIIDKYIVPVTNTLAAMVGIAVTISIIWGGIQYGSSANNPQKVSAAKQRIVNSIFVLVGFFLFYAFLNWVIPGGLLG